MFVFGFDGCRCAEIDFDALAHDSFAIEDLSDSDSGVFRKERDDDAPERFEGREGVDWGG